MVREGLALPVTTTYRLPVPISTSPLVTGTALGSTAAWMEAPVANSISPVPGPAASGRLLTVVAASGSAQPARVMEAAAEGVNNVDWTLWNAKFCDEGWQGTMIV